MVAAFAFCAFHVLYGTETNIKTYASMNVMGACGLFLSNVLFSVLGVAASTTGSLFRLIRWIIIIVTIGLLLVYIMEYSPITVERFITVYNEWWGRNLRVVIFEGFRLVHTLFSALLPVYNGVVYFIGQWVVKVLISGINIDLGDFLRWVQALADFCMHMVESFMSYTSTFDSCLVNGTVVSSCFEPGKRMLDLITPMADVRNMAAYAVSILTFNCAVAGAPVDLMIYPLMDINLAKAVHNLVNSVLLFVIQVPVITKERCEHTNGTRLSVLMCTPDFEPAWKVLSAGLRFLGRVIDNWLNIATIILEEIITGDAPTCEAPPLTQDLEVDTSKFGTNATAVVGLTSSMYAITDGWSSEYVVYDKAAERLFVQPAWPFPINVAYGVAAIKYTDSDASDYNGQRTTSMLGCKCEDVFKQDGFTSQIAITCAITPFDPEAYDTMKVRSSAYQMPVEFQTQSTATFLQCNQIQVSVQSVRWPLTRMARPDAAGVLRNIRDPLQDYADAGPNEEPAEADAVVYVIPRCTNLASVSNLACLENFKQARCYPYCMAVRLTGSMNSALVLYNSDDWEDHVQLMKRDCGLERITLVNADDGLDNGYTYVRDEDVSEDYFQLFSINGNNDVNGTTYTTKAVEGDVTNEACNYSPTVATRVKKEMLGTYSDLKSVRLQEQPLMVAGDASLFVRELEEPVNGISAYVYVKRFIGTESYQFTLWTMPQQIPVLGACATLSECTEMDMDPSLITIPRAYSENPLLSMPTVATRWSVLFAVNPSPSIYDSYFVYCTNQSTAASQFVVESAYAPIRIWRVNAFSEDGYLYEQIKQSDASQTLLSFNGRMTWDACANPINMSVTNMAYLNEYNVAVTVLVAAPTWYDIVSKTFMAGREYIPRAQYRYEVYYMNPKTMQLQRHAMWQEEEAKSLLAQGYLCPAMRRAPPIGSALAEIMIAATVFVRYPLSLLVNLPALAPQNLRYVRECPVITQGHTVLRECGASILSLDFFWYSLIRGNRMLWQVFSSVSNLLAGKKGAELTRTVLNGVSVAGQDGYNIIMERMPYFPNQAAKSFAENVNIPIPYFPNGLLQMTFRVMVLSTGLAQWIYETVQNLIVNLLSTESKDSLNDSLLDFLSELWKTIYDQRVRYDELVTTPLLSTCTGLALTMGWNNPVAQITRDGCIVGANLVPAILNVADVYFVHFPMLHCMCSAHAGRSQTEIAQICFQQAPLRYKPVISEVSKRGAEQISGMCKSMTGYVNFAHSHALDEIIRGSQQLAEHIEPLFDYVRVLLFADTDSDWNQCSNSFSNPFVMTLMPFPIDYWRQCGSTPTCRLRCKDLFQAFEVSLENTQYLGTRTIRETVAYEKPFFTNAQIEAGLNQAPFQILGMIEHLQCQFLCQGDLGLTTGTGTGTTQSTGTSSQMTSRCFSVAGISNAELVIAFYCTSRQLALGTFEIDRWTVADSKEWIDSVLKVSFLHVREPAQGKMYDPIVVVRTDGVYICDQLGVRKRLVQNIGDELFYTQDKYSFSTLTHMYVIPVLSDADASTDEYTSARIFFIGTLHYRTASSTFIVEQKCLQFKVFQQPLQSSVLNALDSSWIDRGTTCSYSNNLQVEIGDHDMVVRVFTKAGTCVPANFLSCQLDIALVPRDQAEKMLFCKFNMLDNIVSDCITASKTYGFDVASTISNLHATFSDSYGYDRTGTTFRTSSTVSQTSVVEFTPSGLTQRVFTFFSTSGVQYSGAWLSDVRVVTITEEQVASASNIELDIRRQQTIYSEVALELTESCSIMSCFGCKSVTTKKLCYAAQQCALSECVGSRINLRYPTCMWGQVLKEAVETGVALVHAFWVAYSSIMTLVVDASTGLIQPDIRIGATYDALDMIVCDAKDVVYSVVAAFTSIVNWVVVDLVFLNAQNAANTVNVYLSTQIIATLTNFIAHIFSIFWYVPAALLHSTSCYLNTFLAIFDATGNILRLAPRGADQGLAAWESVAGQCLSKMADESVSEYMLISSQPKNYNMIGRLFEQVFERLLLVVTSIPLEYISHLLDALFTYVAGLVYTTQDLVYVADFKHCKLPDTTMKDVVTCACGDTPMQIPDSQANVGVYQSAFWCTGTLGMLERGGGSKIIFNPYTFQELRDVMEGKITEYLACVSGQFDRDANCWEREPVLPRLEQQGVSTLAVFNRCRSNYVYSQWDEAAALLFDYTKNEDLIQISALITQYFNLDTYTTQEEYHESVAQCMLQSLQDGISNSNCLKIYLRGKKLGTSEYFAYTQDGLPQDTVYELKVDACQVFTGPSQAGRPAFRDCYNNIANPDNVADTLSECNIPFILWSGQSKNKVAIAVPHFLYKRDQTSTINEAKQEIAQARNEIINALQQFLETWEARDLRVSLFSSEGDALHQAMDCLIMGPYSSAQLWPTDTSPNTKIDAIEYSRGDALSRAFQMPCSGDALRGDFELPFTCGSTSRRAIFKYFFRDFLQQQTDAVEDRGRLEAILSNKTLALVGTWLTQWQAVESFGCPCNNGETYRVECCSSEDPEAWYAFKEQFQNQLSVSAAEVNDELIADMGRFARGELLTNTYEVLTKYADGVSFDSAGDINTYAWSVPEALLATDLGLYDPTQPLSMYDSGNAGSPLKRQTSLWQLCTAYISSPIFTLPIGPIVNKTLEQYTDQYESSGSPSTEPFTSLGYLNHVEAYVKRITAGAYSKSPLYWHHVLRYVPSDSVICLDYTAFKGNISYERKDMDHISLYDDERLNADDIPDIQTFKEQTKEALNLDQLKLTAQTPNHADIDWEVDWKLIRQYGVHYHALSSMQHRCVCSWQENYQCYFPAVLCAYVEDTSSLALLCRSPTDNDRVFYDIPGETVNVHALVHASLPIDIECDDMYPSDAWGIVQKHQAEDWISDAQTDLQTAMYDILTTGRSGMRIGNLLQLRSKWSTFLHPSRRLKPLVNDYGRLVAQEWCHKSTTKRLFVEDLRKRFIDDLFPVVQAVRGSLPTETCTRYMLEIAISSVYDYLKLDAAVSQELVAQQWRRKCENQMDAIAMCNLRGVYEVMPDVQQPTDCPFMVATDSRPFYVTEACLVYFAGDFYDPCLCQNCPVNHTRQATWVLDVITADDCKIRGDPRHMALHSEYGGNFQWALKNSGHMNSSVYDRWVVLATRLAVDTEKVVVPPSLNGQMFYDRVHAFAQNGLFNTYDSMDGVGWEHSEGISKDAQSTRFCDSVLDWWPESWQAPVGFHVTVPPFADETAFRSFDNAFVVNVTESGEVVMVYEHEYMRNQTLMKNHFGASGVCNTISYGMPLFTTNTMRACTAVSENEYADPSVPLKANRGLQNENTVSEKFLPETCGDNYFLPLQHDDESNVFTGLVLNWDDPSSSTWPNVASDLPKVHIQLSDEFGSVQQELDRQQCSFPLLSTCRQDSDCTRLALNVDLRSRFKCYRGVCVLNEQSYTTAQNTERTAKFECASHANCQSVSSSKLCSGFGMCVEPWMQYDNQHNVPIKAQTMSRDCSGEQFSTWGTSDWETVSNILRDSGMCSYRNWFDTSQLIIRACGQKACVVNGRETKLERSSPYVANDKSLWEDRMLQMQPHVCDRDYMHVTAFDACVPRKEDTLCHDQSVEGYSSRQCAPRARAMRTYNEVYNISLYNPVKWRGKPFGFLGFDENLEDMYNEGAITDKSNFEFCSEIPQCYLPLHIVDGTVVQTRKTLIATGSITPGESVFIKPYEDNSRDITFADYFYCGAFGVKYGDTRCILDPAMVPLFYAICVPGDYEYDTKALEINERIWDSCNPVIDLEQTKQKLADEICRPTTFIYNRYANNNQMALDKVVETLNQIANSLLKRNFDTFKRFRELSTCVRAIWDVMQDHPMLQHPVMQSRIVLDDDVVKDVTSNGMYYFDENYPHSATYIPFAWWVKCTVMSGIVLQSDAKIACDAWDKRTSQITEQLSVYEALLYLEADFVESRWETIRSGEALEYTQICQKEQSDFVNTDFAFDVNYALSALQDGRQTFLQRQNIAQSLRQTCYTRKFFKEDTILPSPENRRIVQDWTRSRQNVIPDTILTSTLLSERNQAINTHEVWDNICLMWFKDNEWFTEVDDIKTEPYNTAKGIPLGSYRYMQKTALGDEFKPRVIRDQCFETTENDPDDVFLLYLYEPGEEPSSFSEMFSVDNMPYTSDFQPKMIWEHKSLYSGEASWATVRKTRNNVAQAQRREGQFFTANLCTPPSDKRAIQSNGKAALRRKLLDEENDYDWLGQACDLSRNSRDDSCDYAALSDYNEQIPDGQLYCGREDYWIQNTLFQSYQDMKRGSTAWDLRDDLRGTTGVLVGHAFGYPIAQSFLGASVQNPLNIDSSLVYDNPRSDVCWAHDSTCVGSNMSNAKYMWLPPGVQYSIFASPSNLEVQPSKKRTYTVKRRNYFDTPSSLQTYVYEDAPRSEIPAWLMCPGTKEKSILKNNYICTTPETAQCFEVTDLQYDFSSTLALGDELKVFSLINFAGELGIEQKEVEGGQTQGSADLDDVVGSTFWGQFTTGNDICKGFKWAGAKCNEKYTITFGPGWDFLNLYDPLIKACPVIPQLGFFGSVAESQRECSLYLVSRDDFDATLRYCQKSTAQPPGCFWQDDAINQVKPFYTYDKTAIDAEIASGDSSMFIDKEFDLQRLEAAGKQLISLRLQLHSKFTCCTCDTGCEKGLDITEFQTCRHQLSLECQRRNNGRLLNPIAIRNRYFYCYDGLKIARKYCEGSHACKHNVIQGLTQDEKADLQAIGLADGVELDEWQYMQAINVLLLRLLQQKFGFDGNLYAVPEPVPYFAVPGLENFRGFDSTAARAYIASISSGQNDLSVCGAAVNTDSVTRRDYTQCSGETQKLIENFATFVENNYRFDSWYVVPPQSLLSFKTSATSLLGGALLAYSEAVQRNRDTYVKWLLDYKLHCNSNQIYESVCFIPTNNAISWQVLNPWMGGEFNPNDVCDTPIDDFGQRYFDIFCTQAICPLKYESAESSVEDLFYQGIPQTCQGVENPSARMPMKSWGANLCYKEPLVNSTCSHRQSTLGGVVDETGEAVDGRPVEDLYSQITEEHLEVLGGLFGENRNMLFSGLSKAEAKYSKITPLSLKANDIGGHHIRVAVDDRQSFLITDMVLGNFVVGDTDEENVDVDYYLMRYDDKQRTSQISRLQWLVDIERAMNVDDQRARAWSTSQLPADRVSSWDCPFYRLHYWDGGNENFSMPLPDANRAKAMFSDINGAKMAHPMLVTNVSIRNIAQHKTSNAFCFCLQSGKCSLESISRTDTCSLFNTILSNFNEESQEVQMVADVDEQCKDQIDWPYAGGQLRDGTMLPEGWGNRFQLNCSLFARLPAFKFRLLNVDFETANSNREQLSTSEDGGDCHMGRATQRMPVALSNQVRKCMLQSKNDTATVLLCKENGVSKKYVLSRARSLSVQEIIDKTGKRRRYCHNADAMPRFASTKGEPLKNMSSFGIHTRISSERFVASELYRELCLHINCTSRLRQDSWRVTEFMNILFTNPSQLFNDDVDTQRANLTFTTVNYAMRQEQDAVTQQFLDETGFSHPADYLWSQPWAVCKGEVHSGALSRCNASIAKQAWLNADTRVSACQQVFKTETTSELASNISFCDIDQDTDRLCQSITQAMQHIVQAHCVAAGQCITDDYFYQPATFSVSNNEYVRTSVEEYYIDIDADSCPQRIQERQALLNVVSRLQQACAGNAMDGIIEILQLLRTIVHKIVLISYYGLLVLINLLRLLVDLTNYDTIFSNILYYFEKILDLCLQMIQALGEVIIEMLLNTPFGAWLKEIWNVICPWVKALSTILGFIFTGLANMLDLLVTAFEGIRDFDKLGVLKKVLNPCIDAFQSLSNTLRGFAKLGSITCSPDTFTPLNPEGKYSQATRCWADYVAVFADDARSLGCSASDTCVMGISDDVQICGFCPDQPVGINEYACDPIRKVCACGVPVLERTRCVNNLGCTLDTDASCSLINNNLDVTFGTIGCAQCEHKPICLLDDSVGVCTCPLSTLTHEGCSVNDIGDNVYYNTDGLCLTALGAVLETAQRKSNAVLSNEELLSVSCRKAGVSGAFCREVQYNAFSRQPKVLTFATQQAAQYDGPFRRLLHEGQSAATIMLHEDWGDSSGFCSGLVQAWRVSDWQHSDDLHGPGNGLGITDRHHLSACLKWKQVGRDLVRYYNLTAIDEHFLLSFTDFAREMSDLQSLAQLVASPGWVFVALLKTEYMQPVIALTELLAKWRLLYHKVGNTSNIAMSLDLLMQVARGADTTLLTVWEEHNFTTAYLHAYQMAYRDVYNTVSGRVNRSGDNYTYIESWEPLLFMHQMAPSFLLAPLPPLYAKMPPRVSLNSSFNASFNTSNSMAVESDMDAQINVAPMSKPRRSILYWTDQLSDVEEFSVQVSLSGTATAALPKRLADNWLLGPPTWPPDYSYWKKGKLDCVAGELTVELFLFTGKRVVQAYRKSGPTAMIPASTFKGSALSIPDSYTAKFADNKLENRPMRPENAGFIFSVFYQLQDWMSETGIRNKDIYNLFYSIPDTLREFFTCDIDEVMFCTKYRRTVWHSFWWLALFSLVLLTVFQFLQVSLPLLLSGILFVVVLLFYSMEYSIFCVPMIPHCAYNEWLEIISFLVPSTVQWPNSLQKYPGCVTNRTQLSATESCLIPCSTEPHAYSKWEAPLAWWLCAYDAGVCISFRNWLQANNIPGTTILQRYLTQKAQMVNYNDPDLTAAQNICATLTIWFITPWILLLLVLITLLTWLPQFPFLILQNAMQVLVQTIIMSNVQRRALQSDNLYVQASINERLR